MEGSGSGRIRTNKLRIRMRIQEAKKIRILLILIQIARFATSFHSNSLFFQIFNNDDTKAFSSLFNLIPSPHTSLLCPRLSLNTFVCQVLLFPLHYFYFRWLCFCKGNNLWVVRKVSFRLAKFGAFRARIDVRAFKIDRLHFEIWSQGKQKSIYLGFIQFQTVLRVRFRGSKPDLKVLTDHSNWDARLGSIDS